MRSVLACGLSVALLCGCSDVFGSEPGLVVLSDASSYLLGNSARFTVINRAERSVNFMACAAGVPRNPLGKIDVRANGRWREVDGFGGICTANMVPVTVPLGPGESFQFGLSLSRSEHRGTLRIRLLDGNGEIAASNVFTVAAP